MARDPRAHHRVLVTGCSTGIGRALALEFAQRGCDVLATARNLESIAELKHERITIARVDVCEPNSLVSAVQQFGAVDICVANAGMSGFSPLGEQDLKLFDKIICTNVTGVVATVQAVAPSMLDRRTGQIVIIGSVSGAMITPFAGAYCASKAAVSALCDAMRMEFSPFGIGVLEVVTGAVRSNFGSNAASLSKLPAHSRYGSLQSYIDARAMASQSSDSMEPADYAKTVVDAALDGTRMRLVAGGNARKYHLIGRVFPRGAWAKKMSQAFGLHTLDGGDLRAKRAPAQGYMWLSLIALAAVVAWVWRS